MGSLILLPAIAWAAPRSAAAGCCCATGQEGKKSNPTKVLQEKERRSSGDLLLLQKPRREESFSSAAMFQNSELILKALTVSHAHVHSADRSAEAEMGTAQTCTALRGVKRRLIFPRAQPTAAVSADGLAQVQCFGKKFFIDKRNPNNKNPNVVFAGRGV